MTTSNDQQGEQKVSNRRNGHRPLAVTLPLVEVLSSEIDDAPGPEEGSVQTTASSGDQVAGDGLNVPLGPSIQDVLEDVRERLGLPKREWPVEAERSSERSKYKQSIAVELLASGMTVTEVAKKLGVVPSTVHRWLNDPFFVAELEARRDEIVESMLDQHLLASRMATAKLMKLMDSDNEQVALRAAATLYAGGHRAYQFMDVRKRIERLEDNLGMVYGSKV